jgi:hypothetical protein
MESFLDLAKCDTGGTSKKLSVATDWRAKFMALCGTFGGLKRHYYFVAKSDTKGPLDKEEQRALRKLVDRATHLDNGLQCLQVPTGFGGVPSTYLNVTKARDQTVGRNPQPAL